MITLITKELQEQKSTQAIWSVIGNRQGKTVPLAVGKGAAKRPAPRFGRKLEPQLRSELRQPGVDRPAADGSEAQRVQVGIKTTKVGVVERVEKLRTELQPESLGDRDVVPPERCPVASKLPESPAGFRLFSGTDGPK
jgi:hypothetical protein